MIKILSCHVDGFGTLHQYDVTFTDGLNTILQNNGTGKSTLAAFICAMFFGLTSASVKKSARSEYENDRQKYTPWNKDGYGGWLIFETKGKQYKILRRFSEKKASEDEFELRDASTNLPSNDFDSNIGEELFAIDQDSFLRTAFISEQDIRPDVTAKINAKIGNLSQETADMGNYEEVMQMLEDRMTKMSPGRKTGLIYKNEETLKELDYQISFKDSILQQFKQRKDNIDTLHAQEKKALEARSEIQAKLKELSAIKDRQALQTSYETLKNSAADAQAAYAKDLAHFPKGVPAEKELDAYFAQAGHLDAIEQDIQNNEFTTEERSSYSHLLQAFAQGVPNDTVIQRVEEDLDTIKEVQNKILQQKLSSQEEAQYRRSEEKFHGLPPQEQELNDLKDQWDSRCSRLTNLPFKKNAAAMMQPVQNTVNHSGQIVLILGCALLCLSIVGAFVLKNLYLILGGAVLFLLCLLFALNQTKKARAAQLQKQAAEQAYQQQLDDIAKDEQYIAETEKTVGDALVRINGRFHPDTAGPDLIRLNEEVRIYQDMKQRQDELLSQPDVIALPALKEKVHAFLETYLAVKEDNEENAFRQLIYNKKEYLALQEKEKNYKAAIALLHKNTDEITAFLNTFGYAIEQDPVREINTLRTWRQHLLETKDAYTAAENKLNAFKDTHDISLLSQPIHTEGLGSMEELAQQLKDLQKELDDLGRESSDLQKQMDGLSENLDQIEELETQQKQLKEVNDKDRKLLSVITATKDYLEKARQSFSQKYMAPIQKAYAKYYHMLAGSDAKDYELDADLNLTYVAYGKNHNTAVLSKGYQDVVGLCRRMAFVDAMYPAEKPFLLLDDPFAHLDDEKLAGAKEFLKKVSQEYQVIYFTCNEYKTIH